MEIWVLHVDIVKGAWGLILII